jgi:hypothetical protein
MIQLSAYQIFIVGVAATILSSLVSWLVEKGVPAFLAWTKIKVDAKIDLGRFVKTLIVGVAVFGLSIWWFPMSLPALPAFSGDFGVELQQFFAWLPSFFAALSPFVGSAMALYNLVLGYITDPAKRQQLFLNLLKTFFPNGFPPVTPPLA